MDLARDREAVIRMGAAARTRIHQGFREVDTIAAVADMYGKLFPASRPQSSGANRALVSQEL
jgi:hypothetical protein